MLTRLLAALILCLVSTVPVAAQWKTVDTFTIKGAHGLIIIPKNWNGSLFIYAHGYSADQRLLKPFPPDLSLGNYARKLNLLLQSVVVPTIGGLVGSEDGSSFASATTTFRSAGWVVKDAIKDIENVRRYFIRKYGKPKRTYLWGHSGGGMVTSTVIEYFPKTYAGALPMCGPAAGARRNFNGAFDLRAVYEYVCRDVPASRLACGLCSDGRNRCVLDADCPAGQTCGTLEADVPPEDGLTRECTEFLLTHPERFNENPTAPRGDFVAARVTACFGDLTGATSPSPEQAARKDLYLRATQVPENFIGTDMFFASIGLAEIVHRRNKGKHPWGNMDVDYAPPALTAAERAALNDGVPRVREDAAAVSYMRRFYEPRARTSSKVLTVHAFDDGLVLPENENKYREMFAAAGRNDQLVQLHTLSGGHCGFIPTMLAALPALVDWVEKDRKPTLASVQAACPECDLTDTFPGPWGLKVAERRQKAAPLKSFVCGGETGDCPAQATCSPTKHRCE